MNAAKQSAAAEGFSPRHENLAETQAPLVVVWMASGSDPGEAIDRVRATLDYLAQIGAMNA